MLLPALAAAREKARRSSCMNNLGQLGKAIAGYNSDYNSYYPSYGPQDGIGRTGNYYSNESSNASGAAP